jgi:uncharacterized membrane protein
MAVAVLALAGLFVSAYLLLYKLGFYGELMCGAGGSCSVVQASSYAVFLGIPVAGWGTGWYAAVLAVALAGLQPRWSDERWPGPTLLVLAVGGLAFSAYLTWVELFVLDAVCRWCVVSAALVLLIFGLSLPLGTGRVPLAGREGIAEG